LLIKDNYRKLVVTADEITEEEIQGVEIWNILKFLTEFVN
jgi:predicted AAA+ superfamily ATPase